MASAASVNQELPRALAMLTGFGIVVLLMIMRHDLRVDRVIASGENTLAHRRHWRFSQANGGSSMSEIDRLKYLKLALRVIAVVFVVGFYPLTVLWPSGWSWHPGQSEYLQMIIAIYATLGVFLWLASRNPDQHLSLVSFTIWSSVAHAVTMAVQSVANTEHAGHLYGDVPALLLVAAVLGWLSPRALTLRFGAPR